MRCSPRCYGLGGFGCCNASTSHIKGRGGSCFSSGSCGSCHRGLFCKFRCGSTCFAVSAFLDVLGGFWVVKQVFATARISCSCRSTGVGESRSVVICYYSLFRWPSSICASFLNGACDVMILRSQRLPAFWDYSDVVPGYRQAV